MNQPNEKARQSRDQSPDFACNDFTPQPRAREDVTIPYWPADFGVDVDAPVAFSAWGVE